MYFKNNFGSLNYWFHWNVIFLCFEKIVLIFHFFMMKLVFRPDFSLRSAQPNLLNPPECQVGRINTVS